MANGQIDGKTWSIPFQRSTIVLYWNKDAFKEAGLDPDKAPASWDEMIAIGKKLVKKDAGGNVVRWGVEIPTTGYAYWMLQALAIENGQKLMNDAGNEVYLTAPKTVAALITGSIFRARTRSCRPALWIGRRCVPISSKARPR